MDTSLLKFSNEQFFTFQSFNDESNDETANNGQFIDWTDTEHNGDIIPIEMSNSVFRAHNTDELARPPSTVVFTEHDWALDEVINTEFAKDPAHEEQEPKNDSIFIDHTNLFDITTYINDEIEIEKMPLKEILAPKLQKAPVKKLDLNAQEYIPDNSDNRNDNDDNPNNQECEQEIDIETVCDDVNGQPVLEASDTLSLLEQFEKSEDPKLTPVNNDKENLLQSNTSSSNKILPKTTSIISSNNKQILDALPQELIQRINESGKRKNITVIDPIPNKKRRNDPNKKNTRIELRNHVPLDHDYCNALTPYPKECKKDSGFESCEEDDNKNNTIRNQPVVKNTDGTLMVSLLKSNTIQTQKKKLNLEEYKKRRPLPIKIDNEKLHFKKLVGDDIEDETTRRLKHQKKLMQMADELLKTQPGQKMESINLPEPILVIEGGGKENIVDGENVPAENMEVKTYVSVGCNTSVCDFDITYVKQLETIKPLIEQVSDKLNSSSFILSMMQNVPKVKEPKASGAGVEAEQQEIVREDKVIYYLKKDRDPKEKRDVECQTNISLLMDHRRARYRRREKDCFLAHSSHCRGENCSIHSPPMVRDYHRLRSGTMDGSGYSSSGGESPPCTRPPASPPTRRPSPPPIDFSIPPIRTVTPGPVRHPFRGQGYCSISLPPVRHVASPSRECFNSDPLPHYQLSLKFTKERVREVEERRVVYVGGITRLTTKYELRTRFMKFGKIMHISLHFRDEGDNYAFVTFAKQESAFKAVDHGNESAFPKYELSFGGRRLFCKSKYTDLDAVNEENVKVATSEIPATNYEDLLNKARLDLFRCKST